jgi:endogenous inhibitor of DNA gyrase (YacG/DUF329 family)
MECKECQEELKWFGSEDNEDGGVTEIYICPTCGKLVEVIQV